MEKTQAVFQLPSPFYLKLGGELLGAELSYTILGDESALQKKPTIWICHGLTGSGNPQEWWSELVGQGKCLDTQKFNVIGANMLGSCYGSTGPTSINPKSGKAYQAAFPEVSFEDQVEAFHLLKTHLGISSISLLIGGSMGGQLALRWANQYPKDVNVLALLACNARQVPWTTAFNEVQRQCLNSVENFEEAMVLARSIAMISYRSPEDFRLNQHGQHPDGRSKISTYLRHQGEKLAARFDRHSYVVLSKMMDGHALGESDGECQKALRTIDTSTLVIGISSDWLFPVEEQKFIAKNLHNGFYHEISSTKGHDGFLTETTKITQILQSKINFL